MATGSGQQRVRGRRGGGEALPACPKPDKKKTKEKIPLTSETRSCRVRRLLYLKHAY